MLPGRQRSHERMSHREPQLPRNQDDYRASSRHEAPLGLGMGERITVMSACKRHPISVLGGETEVKLFPAQLLLLFFSKLELQPQCDHGSSADL